MAQPHPYKALPPRAFWKKSVAEPAAEMVDPVGVFDLRITRDTLVATAGSCFAQHIARHLQTSGYKYFVAETGHPNLSASIKLKNGYGLFSARYGNIYTARQLLQIFERAYGRFTPQEPAWTTRQGTLADPFRPSVQPGGFISVDEMLADRQQHLVAVRRMFEQLDVFVFTLGLTECWRARADGAVFPVCPGVEAGEFDDGRYEFCNLGVEDVVQDLSRFVEGLRQVNPKAQLVLTVSPVPLAATASPGAHVLAATTYSKSVLRVGAETLTHRFSGVHYFPSYEIITGSFNRGAYFAPDLRNVLESGVAHVMRSFLAHATGEPASASPVPPEKQAEKQAEKQPEDDFARASAALIEVECDESALDP